MRLLLDTHLVLWAAGQPERLSPEARGLIGAPDNEPWFSVASLWEVAIKNGLARPDFHVDVRLFRRGLLDNGYHELAIDGEHAMAVDLLPPLHKDPFDRLLIAQSVVEGIVLITADRMVAQYSTLVRLVEPDGPIAPPSSLRGIP